MLATTVKSPRRRKKAVVDGGAGGVLQAGQKASGRSLQRQDAVDGGEKGAMML
jgi:hypothetical protein